MQCIDIRWKLSDFLSGGLDEYQNEEVAEHLERCPECAIYLLRSGKVEQCQIDNVPLNNKFTSRVVKSTLASRDENSGFNFLGLTLVGSLLFSFLAMFMIRHFTSGDISTQLSAKAVEAENLLLTIPLFSNLMDDSLVNYLVLAFAALILCSGLILLVDISDQLINKSNTRRKEIKSLL